MLKNSLAMIAIGCLVASSSFATPFFAKKMFMKESITESSMVSKDHTQSSKSRFTGTWAGTCTFHGESDEVKIRIVEDDYHFSLIDLMDEFGSETLMFDVLESKTHSNKDYFSTFTNRLTRTNAHTRTFEGIVVFGSHSKEKLLISGSFTSTFKVNNNQLTIDTAVNPSGENKDGNVDKCILKRAE